MKKLPEASFRIIVYWFKIQKDKKMNPGERITFSELRFAPVPRSFAAVKASNKLNDGIYGRYINAFPELSADGVIYRI